MKIKFAMLFIALFTSCFSYAQNFKGHVSGTLGIINTKVRVQYELPLKDRASFGINMNYYLQNWKGPVFEPFIRIYRKKEGNTEGVFAQAKMIYGNLLGNYNSSAGDLEDIRSPIYGFGLNAGYKFLFGKHFTVEPLLGLRLLSAPSNLGDETDWYLSTGFPLDFQLKFGFQF
ncbi:MAG: DUF3575 domain-containing protein [Bacteroides sp.]|jgi:hypothetical protein|nr:DUF3575 domain-containing protein [Bacteroides sp.]